jgi:hypothetical protein
VLSEDAAGLNSTIETRLETGSLYEFRRTMYIHAPNLGRRRREVMHARPAGDARLLQRALHGAPGQVVGAVIQLGVQQKLGFGEPNGGQRL